MNIPIEIIQLAIILALITIVCVFFLGILYALVAVKRKRYIDQSKFNLTFMQIKLPPQNEYEIEAAEHFFSNLAGVSRSFFDTIFKGQYRTSFEIVGKKDGIGFYVSVPDELVTYVEQQINGAYPTAEIDLIDPNEVWDRGAFTEITELKLKGLPYFPIKTYKDMEKSDSLNAITSGLSNLKDQEVICIQYLVSPASNTWRNAGSNFIAKIKAKSSNPEKTTNVDSSIVEGVEKKISKSGFDVLIRVVSVAENKMVAQNHIRNVVGSFEQFTNVRYNRFTRTSSFSKQRLIDNFIYRSMNVVSLYIPILGVFLYRNTSILNIEELATIFHFPNKEVGTPNIKWLNARKVSAPTNIPTEGLFLGNNIFRNTKRPIYMKEEDRKRHMYIIGQTGTGKSQFMMSLVLQDIINGEGLCVVDPHGSDVDELLEKIPEERVDDVILFDVSDTQRPIGLNILEADTDEQRNMLVNAFIGLLYKLYDPNRQGIMGPQLERSVRNVMLTAMTDKESTMVDVLRLLIDEDYSKKFLPNVTDPLIRKYWTDEMAKTSANRKGEMMGYIVSKFDRIVTEKTMRNIFGQPSSAINFNKIMAEKKILLVDLSKGKIGEENSNFLGLVLVPRILAAALGRATMLGKEEFPNFFLYVDEFQNFATDDFATILSEARKYKLNLIVAHQFVAQLQDNIKEAVFGNVGTLSAFRIGTDDAEYLQAQFDPVLTKSDLINNPIGGAYMRMLVDGHPSTPFSMSVDWDKISATPKNKEIAQRIREQSRQKYGRPVAEVEAFINERAGINETKEEDPAQNFRKMLPF